MTPFRRGVLAGLCVGTLLVAPFVARILDRLDAPLFLWLEFALLWLLCAVVTARGIGLACGLGGRPRR